MIGKWAEPDSQRARMVAARVQRLASRIADDLAVDPRMEPASIAYGIARVYVVAREDGRNGVPR